MMKHDEFISLCRAVTSGNERHVQHIITHQVGKIIACDLNDDFFEVEVQDGTHKTWSKDNVREMH